MRRLLVVAGLAMLLRSVTGGSAEVAPVSLNLFLPVVLEAPGRNGAWYSTELTLTNAGSTPARVVLTYRAIDAIGATGSGSVEETLPAGRQSVIPALIPYLRGRGIPIPEAGAQGGTLRVRFEGVSSAAVAGAYARTTTPSSGGRAGVGYRAVRVDLDQRPTANLMGLRETDSDRSNVGLANADPSGPVTLRVTVIRGLDAKAVQLPDVALPPGGWIQFDSVLNQVGAPHGYVRVERVAGSGPFLAYAVIHDNVTGDGAYVEGRPSLCDDPAGRDLDWFALPVVTESASTTTEVTYASCAGGEGVRLRYQESLADRPSGAVQVDRPLATGEQLLVNNVFDEFRAEGLIGPAPARAGRLLCYPYCALICGANAAPATGRVLTRAADGIGRFGVSIPVIEAAAHRSAWVFGLRQDGSVRSNLVLTNPDFGNLGPISLRIELFDGETGVIAGTMELPPLRSGAWTQVNSILRQFGVTQGYARITALGPQAFFYAYGVINDGASPGEGTGDASFVPMTIEE